MRECGCYPCFIRRLWLLGLLLALISSGLLPAAAVQASAPASPLHVRLSLSGYIMEKSAGQWRIDANRIAVDAQTRIDESQYPADLYAYVGVIASHTNGQTMPHADTITVMRPAGAGGPLVQLAGPMKGATDIYEWSVAGQLVKVPQQVYPLAPPVGALVSIIAEDRQDTLWAMRVEVVAGDPNSVPVEFEGQVTSINADLQTWLIDSELTVRYTPLTTYPNGIPQVGDTVEVRARLSAGGELTAEIGNVKAQATQAALYAFIRDVAAGSGGAQSWSVEAGWSYPTAISEHLSQASGPALAYTNDGAAHAVWETNGQLLYASRPLTGTWSAASRIAAGMMPALVAADDGTLHLVFSHQFMGNDEIYYVTLSPGSHWTLPINVSHTSGKSFVPSLAVTPDHHLHVAWMDNSPGDWVVYYGVQDDDFWSSVPVPNGRGEIPELAASSDGTLYLAWSSQIDPANAIDVDVFLSQQQGGTWSIPANISDTPGVESTDVTLTATSDGMAHLAWLERRSVPAEQWTAIYYSYGRGIAWQAPSVVASSINAIQEPRLTTDRDAILLLTWLQGQTIQATYGPLRPGVWQTPSSIVMPPAADLRDIAVAAIPHGGVSVSWVQVNAVSAGEVTLYESSHASVLKALDWLPLLAHP